MAKPVVHPLEQAAVDWLRKLEKKNKRAAQSIAVALMLGVSAVNRVTGYGHTPRPADHEVNRYRVSFASAWLGLQQHYVWSVFDDATVCGLMTNRTSTSPVRTLVGVTCWRCALLTRGVQK